MLELQSWSQNRTSVMQSLLIVSFIVSVVSLLALVPFFVAINYAQREVLTLFLDIPLIRVRRLF